MWTGEKLAFPDKVMIYMQFKTSHGCSSARFFLSMRYSSYKSQLLVLGEYVYRYSVVRCIHQSLAFRNILTSLFVVFLEALPCA